MILLAHRGFCNGIEKSKENSLLAVRYCLEQGWGVETDIRRSPDGYYYISHDPTERTDANHADRFCELIRLFPEATIALNIKELGYENDLLQYLNQQEVARQIFLFDMELLEVQPGRTAALFHKLDSEIRLAARVSDREETIDRALTIEFAEIIWLDEFDHLWATGKDIERMKSAGKTIYAISPEIHGFSLSCMYRRWQEFYSWGIDGICTDYPAELAKQLSKGFKGGWI